MRYAGRERRRFKRKRAFYVMKTGVQQQDSNIKWDLGITHDISSGGVLFYHNREMSPGDLLEITIKVPEGPAMKRKARVLRNEKPLKKDLHRLAAEFTDIEQYGRYI